MQIGSTGRALVVLFVLGLLAGLTAARARAASFAILDSDAGDPIGGGGHYQLGSPERVYQPHGLLDVGAPG